MKELFPLNTFQQDAVLKRLNELSGVYNGEGEIDAKSIAADSIIENMSGYSAVKYEVEGLTIEPVYCGAVKNGNKLTIVCAFNLTRTANIAQQQSLFNFKIPSEVGQKLFPTQVGLYSFLDNKVLKAWKSYVDALDIYAFMDKVSNDTLTIRGDTLNLLELNTKYYLRYEATFLLNDNLISQE